MCKGICDFFEKKPHDKYHYCQDCGRKVGEINMFKEKKYKRLRCKCCNGLVRAKFMVYKV